MKIQPCPICGKEVEIEKDGSCIAINFCVSMERQKTDYIRDYFEDGYAVYNSETDLY